MADDWMTAETIGQQSMATSCWTISASEAQSFLQGLVTKDIAKLPENHTIPCLHLNRQGKIRSWLWLQKITREQFVLYWPIRAAETLLSRWQKWAMLSRISITVQSGFLGAYQPVISSITDWIGQPWSFLGCDYGVTAEFCPKSITAENIQQKLLQAELLPWNTAIDAMWFPHEAGMLAWIDWNKGCYVGQEVVAKIHYRGRPKMKGITVSLTLPDRELIDQLVCQASGWQAGDKEIAAIATAEAEDGSVWARVLIPSDHDDMPITYLGMICRRHR